MGNPSLVEAKDKIPLDAGEWISRPAQEDYQYSRDEKEELEGVKVHGRFRVVATRRYPSLTRIQCVYIRSEKSEHGRRVIYLQRSCNLKRVICTLYIYTIVHRVRRAPQVEEGTYKHDQLCTDKICGRCT